MKADPQKSKGARLERKAMRAYLRRLERKTVAKNSASSGIPMSHFYKGSLDVIAGALFWVLQRQRRYDKRPGGLGKR